MKDHVTLARFKEVGVCSEHLLELTNGGKHDFAAACLQAEHQLEMASSMKRAAEEEEYDEKGNTDPEKLLQCPFDKNHQIRACRFPYHLIKCRKNHPKLASELKTCPFNARHLVQKHELAHHTETCEDRISVDTEEAGSADAPCNWHVPVSTWTNPNMTEDWDEEADNAAIPFIWGETKKLDPKEEMRPTSNLGPSFRSPSSLPWSGFK